MLLRARSVAGERFRKLVSRRGWVRSGRVVDLCREKLVYLDMIPQELGGRTLRNRALA